MNKRQKLRAAALALVGVSAAVCVIQKATENQHVQRILYMPTEHVQKVDNRIGNEGKKDDSSAEYTVFQFYKRSELDVPADEYLKRVMEVGQKRHSNPVLDAHLRRLRPVSSSQNMREGEVSTAANTKEEAKPMQNTIRKIKMQERRIDAETAERIRRAASVPMDDFDSELFSMPVFLQDPEEGTSTISTSESDSVKDKNILFDTTNDDIQAGGDTAELGDPSRSRVFAFYEAPIDSNNDRGEEKNDSILQEQWKATWAARGYEPEVLTLETAKKHPKFEEYVEALDRILERTHELPHSLGSMRNCYFRYLAMAVAGGGTMVDLDVFPVNNFNNETTHVPSRFTLFCGMANAAQGTDDSDSNWLLQVSSQSGLPCAAVGSAEEWERAFKHLGWVSWLYRDSDHWSDMNSLTYLKRLGEIDYKEEVRVASLRTRPCQKCSFRLNV